MGIFDRLRKKVGPPDAATLLRAEPPRRQTPTALPAWPQEQPPIHLGRHKHAIEAKEGGTLQGKGYHVLEDGTSVLVRPEDPRLAALGVVATKVVGVKYAGTLDDPTFAPGRPLALVAEPDNPVDEHAVAIWNAERTKRAGWLPKKEAARVSAAMGAGEGREAVSLFEYRLDGGERVSLQVLVAPPPVMAKLKAKLR